MTIEETPHAKPSGFLTFVWAIFFFIIFALVVCIWARNGAPLGQVEDNRAAARIEKREALQKADDERLGTVGWVDKAKGVAHIPLADARKLVLAELNSKKPAASQVKVEPALPMPAPYDPDAKEPAPPALPSSPQGADTIRFETAPSPAAAAAPAALPAPIETKK